MSTLLKMVKNSNITFTTAILLGIFCGYIQWEPINLTASAISQIYINLLKLISLPIIFLSLLSTASSLENVKEIKTLGRKVVKYTLLTTVIAASLALTIYLIVNPAQNPGVLEGEVVQTQASASTYVDYLLKTIPSNIVQPFSENNVIGVLLLAMMLSFATLALPSEKRATLHGVFSSLYAAIMKIATYIVRTMPIAIWAFLILFVSDLRKGLEVKTLALYLICVLAANLIQAFGVLPSLLKWKNISPLRLMQGMLPALSVAFFTKSSSAALPMAMKCAEDRVKMSPKVASFSLPLCTTINMNACAAFILTTVLFVSESNGITHTPIEYALWVIIATIAAVGNAGVPMGCFFLSSALLASLNVPLNILGIILPFYTLIDMLESAINVWSDSCVTAIVDKEVAGEAPVTVTSKPQEAVGTLEPTV